MDEFETLEGAVRTHGAAAAFDYLIGKFREEGRYPLLFEARLMKARHQLGLPVEQTGPIANSEYEKALIEAARETGSLFLERGDVVRAWPYFRAIGEAAPIAKAIERVAPEEVNDAILEIAYYERVNPRRGFELILERHGICRAITCYAQYPDAEGRLDGVALLLRTIHRDVVTNMRAVIERREGAAPETDSIPELMAGRDWLFEGGSYYVDTSHLTSVLGYALELEEPRPLMQAVELCEYGEHLDPVFAFRGEPPFEDGYRDYAVYLRALAGIDPDGAVAHFQTKLPDAAEALVRLLLRLGRPAEAIDIHVEYLNGAPRDQLACPSVEAVCEAAGRFDRMRDIARENGDLVHYAAALAKLVGR